MALAIWKELRDTLNDSKMPMAVRVAAADGLGELGSSHSQETLLATLRMKPPNWRFEWRPCGH